jgi:triacylglycerol lipase
VCARARLGHGDLPRHPVVVEMVLAELAPGEPVPLDASDCAALGG